MDLSLEQVSKITSASLTKRGPTPGFRSCQKEQIEGDLSVSVVGLYVPYEQNFVVETTFYFCPSAQCVK